MQIRPLSIEGAWEVIPAQHGDPRGRFLEWYRFDRLAEAVGHPLQLAQANTSVSAQGAVRGIHFADVPPGQAKYVTCVRGAIADVVVDIRTGSPRFGSHETVRLDDVERRALYIGEGLGHGFCALTDDAVLTYLCSTTYAPEREHAINPAAADLGIDWPTGRPLLSAKDTAAPSLTEARERGLLPDYEVCRRFYAELRANTGAARG